MQSRNRVHLKLIGKEILNLNKTILEQTRQDSDQKIKKHSTMHRQAVLVILAEKGNMSAREIAQEMFERGLTASPERNHASPRLTELCEANEVEIVGKKICQWTGRSVAIWKKMNNKKGEQNE